jgi:hypothetical protein
MQATAATLSGITAATTIYAYPENGTIVITNFSAMDRNGSCNFQLFGWI